jgi:hypothetical protein
MILGDVNIIHKMIYTTTACIMMNEKMMELVSYAVIQKLTGHVVLVGLKQEHQNSCT